jgi:hypothetical protein
MNSDRQPKDYARHWPNISSSASRAAKKSASSSSDGASITADPPVAKKQVKPRADPEHNFYPILSVNPSLAVNDAESWKTSLAWLECIERW